jgi:signal transduction histidine kinase
MYGSYLSVILYCVILFLTLAMLWFYFGPYRKALRVAEILKEQLNDTDNIIDRKVRERTRHLEEIRDSVSVYAIQKFELAQELEVKNREILEQKDYASKQSDKLREAFDEITKLESFRQQMVRMIIHDLKNPLNVILNMTDTDKIPSKPRSIIRQISFEMLDLIMNILEVQKFEKLKMKIETENLGLANVVSGVTEKISFLLINSAIELKTVIPESVRISADPHIMSRVLENLIGNSIKYTHSGGEIQVIAIERDNDILIEVKDNGSGIPGKYLENLFAEYESGEKAETPYNSSTGIGLSYCKLAVESQGGTIGINSVQGEGTTAWFTVCRASGFNEDYAGKGVEAIPGLRSEKNDMVVVNNSDPGLTDDDIKFLLPVINELKKADIYEVTKIFSMIQSITDEDNTTVRRWKESIEEAVYSANEKRFRKLLDV